MVLTDNELAMLEQLTYLDNAVIEAADLDGFDGFDTQKSKSIEKILACFDEEALKKLEAKDYDIGDVFISGKEWEGFIRTLHNSPMKGLELRSYHRRYRRHIGPVFYRKGKAFICGALGGEVI